MAGMALLQNALMDNIWVALVLFIFVWVFGWAKENLGSAKLAIIFALIVVYLTFWQFPILVWLLVAMFLLSKFGTEFFGRINPFQEKGW